MIHWTSSPTSVRSLSNVIRSKIMSNKKDNVFFKKPDWDYLAKKYPEDIENLKTYWGGRTWTIIDCHAFTDDEAASINHCRIIQSEFWKSMLFEMADGTEYKIPLSMEYDLDYDIEPSPFQLYILTLVNKTYLDGGPIYRVTTKPVDIHKKLDDVKAECSRLQAIIDNEDTFRGCLRLY